MSIPINIQIWTYNLLADRTVYNDIYAKDTGLRYSPHINMKARLYKVIAWIYEYILHVLIGSSGFF